MGWVWQGCDRAEDSLGVWEGGVGTWWRYGVGVTGL